jgi:ABC-type multidrug transport system ATPase subunit
VHKRFGRAEVLKGVDLLIPSGSRVALVGPNGSGKSTLLRAMMGLVECSGAVRLDGRSPFEERVEVARRLAYVPQVAPQLSATVAEVVELATFTRGLPAGAVEAVARRLELDVAEVRHRAFRDLSGGMKQKLLLAMALAAEPSLLVLDEPTASLDARARARLFELCGAPSGGRPGEATLVLCSHRLEELRGLVDHVVELADGRVRFDGALERYLAMPAPDLEPPPHTTHRAAPVVSTLSWSAGHG